MNGYDGSLLNGLLANPQFKSFFHGSNAGIWAGISRPPYWFPETRNRTLDLDGIFEAPKPVNKSLEKKQVLVSEQHGVAVIEKVVA
ncbi:hypothetical protein KCU99_g6968, partial [Aureobasidium melanogenum]